MLLVTVTVWVDDVDPTNTSPNELVLDAANWLATPFPLRFRLCVAPSTTSSSVICSDPESEPVELGLKVTPTVQKPPRPKVALVQLSLDTL